jgi:hypothetical protein
LIILVCGGRKYYDYSRVAEVLDAYVDKDDIIIQGGASGADSLAHEWCDDTDMPCATIHAPWDSMGKQAGIIRNEWMLRLKPDKVLAFPGGRGTAHMIRIAKEQGVEVIEID